MHGITEVPAIWRYGSKKRKINMKKLFLSLATLLVIGSATVRAQKFEELGKTPQMGWSSWNRFGGNIDETLIREIADAFVESGLRDAGYLYLNIDDCWHGERDSLGFIQADPGRFLDMKSLIDYVHLRGLKFGIYSDAGRTTCAGRPGSFGHEYQDAMQYAAWGVDYLKYDWCASDDINPKGAYNLMRDALRAAGRPIFFSMCEWGNNKPWLWAADTGHSWRTTGDIYNAFDGTLDHGHGFVQHGVLQILDMQEGLRKYAGPGHWNDPDMLEVGNGMSYNEDKAHFTMWCMLAAPLILGNDIRNMTEETRSIILNKAVIAIDQDELGVQGLRFSRHGNLEFWFKPLAGGDWAFCILNRGTEPLDYMIDWQLFNFTDEEVSGLSTSFDTIVYDIYDLWGDASKPIGTTKTLKKASKNKNMSVTVPGHDVVLYRLKVHK